MAHRVPSRSMCSPSSGAARSSSNSSSIARQIVTLERGRLPHCCGSMSSRMPNKSNRYFPPRGQIFPPRFQRQIGRAGAVPLRQPRAMGREAIMANHQDRNRGETAAVNRSDWNAMLAAEREAERAARRNLLKACCNATAKNSAAQSSGFGMTGSTCARPSGGSRGRLRCRSKCASASRGYGSTAVSTFATRSAMILCWQPGCVRSCRPIAAVAPSCSIAARVPGTSSGALTGCVGRAYAPSLSSTPNISGSGTRMDRCCCRRPHRLSIEQEFLVDCRLLGPLKLLKCWEAQPPSGPQSRSSSSHSTP